MKVVVAKDLFAAISTIRCAPPLAFSNSGLARTGEGMKVVVAKDLLLKPTASGMSLERSEDNPSSEAASNTLVRGCWTDEGGVLQQWRGPNWTHSQFGCPSARRLSPTPIAAQPKQEKV